ncbi:hypothetical protein J8273_4562 [Carpediemonas membranifera]|uniref:Uncharacterized protein n=1 Tax=Carpediemonas membranifera TaxID=201153 RepID=A0A8J6B6Q1_9EUKA|nr:hypothetical protein J8273_4562 [Carpediemonas membranifera]|eukprot:KAG9393962.1 hypothetical protein J8273_4562 [Carpediemonas membranifera]
MAETIKAVIETETGTLLERLAPVWTSLGLSEDEVSREIETNLISGLREQFDIFASAQEDNRDKHVEDIQSNCQTIRDLFAQLGEEVIDLSFAGDKTVTLKDQLQRTQTLLAETKEKVSQRSAQLEAVQLALEQAVADLGEKFPEELASTTDLSLSRLSKLEAAHKDASERRAHLTETAIQISTTLTALQAELGIDNLEQFSSEVPEAETIHPILKEHRTVEIVPRLIPALEKLVAGLEQVKAGRQQVIDDTYSEVCQIAGLLQEEVPAKPTDLTEAGVAAFVTKKDEMNAQKIERLSELCAAHRETIAGLKETLEGNDQINGGGDLPAESDCSEEALYKLKEVEEAFNQRVEAVLPILDLVGKREKILRDKEQFEKNSADPARLTKRDPGRLLREEKFRNTLKKDLPRINKKLIVLIKEYEAQGLTFMFGDEGYLDSVVNDVQTSNKRVPLAERTAPVRQSADAAEKVKTLPRKGAGSRIPTANAGKRGPSSAMGNGKRARS